MAGRSLCSLKSNRFCGAHVCAASALPVPNDRPHHNLNARMPVNNYYFINTIDHNKIEVKRKSYPNWNSPGTHRFARIGTLTNLICSGWINMKYMDWRLLFVHCSPIFAQSKFSNFHGQRINPACIGNTSAKCTSHRKRLRICGANATWDTAIICFSSK